MCCRKNNSCCSQLSLPLSIVGVVVSLCVMTCASLENFHTFGFIFGTLFLLASAAYLVIICRNKRKQRQEAALKKQLDDGNSDQ